MEHGLVISGMKILVDISCLLFCFACLTGTLRVAISCALDGGGHPWILVYADVYDVSPPPAWAVPRFLSPWTKYSVTELPGYLVSVHLASIVV